MADVKERRQLSIADIMPWALTLVTVLIGIWQFTAQQSQANRKPFLEKQMALAFEVSDTVARLATETDPVKWEENRRDFWRYYWGLLSFVENAAVEGEMVALGRLVPKQPVVNPKLPMTTLGPQSYRLAHALRDMVLTSWNVELPPVQERE